MPAGDVSPPVRDAVPPAEPAAEPPLPPLGLPPAGPQTSRDDDAIERAVTPRSPRRWMVVSLTDREAQRRR
jgi:hypothetical protein